MELDNLTTLLKLDQYRISPMPAAGASRPKRCHTTPRGEIYFKFGMTNNEICAELFAYHLAVQLGIAAAETRLAISADELGVASHDIGAYSEPSDVEGYSVKDYLHVKGFVEVCLFDYIIMNEDRHAGNWGIIESNNIQGVAVIPVESNNILDAHNTQSIKDIQDARGVQSTQGGYA